MQNRLGWACFLSICCLVGTALQGAEPKTQVNIQSWEEVQKQVRNARKVVVIDLWTSTCPKCVEELPQFDRMAKQFAGQPVQFLTVNCDYDGIEGKPPEFYLPDVKKILEREKIGTPTVMLNLSFLDFLEMLELSSTPAVLVYDAEGQLVQRFDNDDAIREEEEFTLQQVRQVVGKLVQQEQPPRE